MSQTVYRNSIRARSNCFKLLDLVGFWNVKTLPSSKELFLQQSNIFDQKSFDEDFWWKTVFNEMIMQLQKTFDQHFLKKFWKFLVRFSNSISREIFFYKNFRTKKSLMKTYIGKYFSRKRFLNHLKIMTSPIFLNNSV